MAKEYSQPPELSAIQAKLEAQKIAFSPIAFEAVICLLRLGVLKSVADTGSDGAPDGIDQECCARRPESIWRLADDLPSTFRATRANYSGCGRNTEKKRSGSNRYV